MKNPTQKNNSLSLRELLATSRPFSWVNTAAPFVASYLISAQSIDLKLIIGGAYFLLAYNLLMYGVNDIFDYESDIKNPRKNSIEGGLVDKSKHSGIWLAIGAVNIPFLIVLIYLGSLASNLVLMALVFFCFSYSAKPFRFKEIPFLDSINSAIHFAGPMVFGFVLAGSPIAWPAIIAFMFWGMASQAFGSIQDIRPDRAAGIASIATFFGAKKTTMYSLWLYLATCIIVSVAYFPFGIFAGFILLAYPLNTMFFLKFRSDARSKEFRRGWKNFMWLNLLCGFWLTQFLLYIYDPFMLGENIVTILAVFLIMLFVLQLCNTLYNLMAFKRPKTHRHKKWPKISIITHGYNQADNISSTMLAAIGQQYPNFEILYADLGSQDNTRKIVAGFQDPRLKIVNIPPLKPGWSLQAWASECLLQKSSGDLVVLISSDTILLPNALSIIAALIAEQDVSLVSLLPADQNKSLAQQIILSQNHFFMLSSYPSAIIEKYRPQSVNASSNCMAFVRSSIEAIGGFSTVKKSPLEDFDLAASVKSQGLKTSFYIGSDVATSQNHASVRLITQQNIRRFYPALHFSMPLTLFLISSGIFVFVLPTVLLIVQLVLASFVGVFLLSAALIIAYLNRLIITIVSKQSVISTLLYPLGCTLAFALLFYSMLEYELLRPRWQKRTEAF